MEPLIHRLILRVIGLRRWSRWCGHAVARLQVPPTN
jgi:hypothetical protein